MTLQRVPWGYNGFRVDNYSSAAPAVSMGTTVTASASANTYGSWAEILTAAQLTSGLDALTIVVNSLSLGVSLNRAAMLEIGVDPAGGTSYTTLIANLPIGNTGNSMIALGGTGHYHFPIRIPSGASVAARVQCAQTTAPDVRVIAIGFGSSSRPHIMPVGQYSETIGATPASSSGTNFAPGNATWGSWASLGTTTQPLWWWNYGFASVDNSLATSYHHYEVAFGDTTNKHLLLHFSQAMSTNEYAGDMIHPNVNPHMCFAPLPAGTELFVRGQCSGTPNGSYSLAMVGIG
jgi:hypothetical protein